MPNASLFTPLQLGAVQLSHRIVMAPLTRLRSLQPGNIPGPVNALYYRQRSSDGGLIVSEATQISPLGQGYPASPGIHSREQVAGWRLVTKAIHEKGGIFFLQLWHVGRISHTSLHPEEGLPVGPSAVRPKGKAFTSDWQMVDFETPRALADDEIPDLIRSYREGAQRALDAGSDGVEIHSANGYLPDQFLQDGVNKRTDLYGGLIENRARLLLEVVDAVLPIAGPGRIGVRLSPYGTFNDMSDSDPVRLFTYVLQQLSARGIAYVHLIEPRSSEASSTGEANPAAPHAAKIFRGAFSGPLIGAGGFSAESADQAVSTGQADAVAFGRLFIANPDLPERIRIGAPLNGYDRATFYGGGEAGYLDYPVMAEGQRSAVAG